MNALELLAIKRSDEYGSICYWLSSIVGEGERKIWECNGELREHNYWKNGKLRGECKIWYRGELNSYKLYKKGQLIKDYLRTQE